MVSSINSFFRRSVLSSSSLSHRVCTIVCAAALAAFMVIQFSPMVGGLSLATLFLGLKFFPHLKGAMHTLGSLLSAAYKRGEYWSGYGNWLEVLAVLCILPVFSFAAWLLYLSFKDFAAKDVTVALLSLFLSVALPVCFMRKQNCLQFEEGSDKELAVRRSNFDRLIGKIAACTVIQGALLLLVLLPGAF
jgi:hypothetical protein